MAAAWWEAGVGLGTILPILKGYIRDVFLTAGVAQATEQPRSEDVISRPGGK